VAQRTLLLRAANTPYKADVTAHVVVGLAVQAGLGPLAVDRLSRAVRRAVDAAPAAVELHARLDQGATVVEIEAGDAGWAAEACRILADHSPRATPGGVELRLRRPQIAAAPDV
jgi:hypothetical protein